MDKIGALYSSYAAYMKLTLGQDQNCQPVIGDIVMAQVYRRWAVPMTAVLVAEFDEASHTVTAEAEGLFKTPQNPAGVPCVVTVAMRFVDPDVHGWESDLKVTALDGTVLASWTGLHVPSVCPVVWQ